MIGIIQPQWIAKIYREKTGRDHLGLGSASSDQILPSLSPGINVLTFHPRYYSFYVFLLDEFWKLDLPRSESSFKEFFRPRDFLFSLGANLCKLHKDEGLGNIVGAQKTEGWARKKQEHYTYDPEYIVSDLGGYGLYYRTVMAELGVIYPGGRGFPLPVDVPSEYGKEVASAFREAVQNTRYYQEYFNEAQHEIPRDVIQEYIHCACLCQLKKNHAPDRPYLIQTFLQRGTARQAQARRETFRLFLDLADQTQADGLDEDAFRMLMYFGETGDNHRYSPIDGVRETYVRWRLYQAREYYAFALNILWKALSTWGIDHGGVYRPLALQAFWEYIETDGLDFAVLAEQLELPAPNLRAGSLFSDLLNWLKTIVDPDEVGFDEKCGILSSINEHLLYWLANARNGPSPSVMVAGMLTMLGLIFLRFGGPAWQKRPEWEIARMGDDRRLSMDLFLRKLKNRLNGTYATIAEIARWLYENDIILQHELVATSKLPENTFRFQREENNLRFQNLGNDIIFNSSRFDAISTTIFELGFCGDLHLPGHELTADGRKLLETGNV